MRKEDIKIFIDGIENPAEPNQALIDAAQRYEKYSERFDNDESAIGNPETWGKRIVEEPKQETTLEEHNYLQGFINQFEEGGEHQELTNEDWTVSRFLEWLKHNNFKIIKNG